MSIRRVSVFGASFVCRVESTRCPVCAALIAISAVSRSRISPTMMTSGSWRRNARSAEANVRPTFGIDVDLVDAGQIDFRRIFGRRDVRVFLVEDVEARVERHGLAAAGRAGHQDHAVRLRQRVHVELFLRRLIAERVDAEHGARRIENTRHDLLAKQRRAGADAEVDRAGLGDAHLDAPVLRDAALGDVEARHDLDARGELRRPAALAALASSFR